MPPPTEGASAATFAVTSRRRQVALAGHRGDEGGARRGLTDPNGPVRATALGALARMGALTSDDIGSAAADADPRVRARAAELAATLRPPVPSVAAGALADPDPAVVEAGCFALGEMGTTVRCVVPVLAGVGRDHPDALCREAAVAALGAIGDPAGLPLILVAAASDKPAVRRRAVLALAPFSGPNVDAALARARTDRDWQVRQAAEDLSGR